MFLLTMIIFLLALQPPPLLGQARESLGPIRPDALGLMELFQVQSLWLWGRYYSPGREARDPGAAVQWLWQGHAVRPRHQDQPLSPPEALPQSTRPVSPSGPRPRPPEASPPQEGSLEPRKGREVGRERPRRGGGEPAPRHGFSTPPSVSPRPAQPTVPPSPELLSLSPRYHAAAAAAHSNSI